MSEDPCKRIVEIQRKAYVLLSEGAVNPAETVKWIRAGVTNLRLLGRLLRGSDESKVHERQKYVAAIRQVKSYNRKLRKILVAGGRLGQREKRSDRVVWEDVESAFKSRLRTGVIVNLKHADVITFMSDARALFVSRIKNALKSEIALKVNAMLDAEYVIVKDGIEIVETKAFNTKNVAILRTTDLSAWFTENVQEPILRDMEEFQERDSGWTLRSLLDLAININKYNPIRGSSYVDLPEPIKRKKACINVCNVDNECFKWALLSALHPTAPGKANRVSTYEPFEDELNFSGIEFPVMPTDVPRFEKQNDVSVNVYILEKKTKRNKYTPAPIYVSSCKKRKHVNLLMVQNYDDDDDDSEETVEHRDRFHYVWIKDLSRLIRAYVSKRTHRVHVCDRCLHYFWSVEKLQNHEIDCREVNTCKVTLPSRQRNTLKFKNFVNKERVPFVVYADFECILKPIQQRDEGTKTTLHHVHEPFSVGFYAKCSYDDTLSFYNSKRDTRSPAKWFVEQLLELAENIETVFLCPLAMNDLTQDEWKEYRSATVCHMCGGSFDAQASKVRDHCHLTGRYRGAAHSNCNLNYQDTHIVPVVFHNLSGYDSHFIIKEISTCVEGRVDLLPLNKERYISFIKNIQGSSVKFRFIDSFRFMASSLDKLASYLTDFKIVRTEFPDLSNDKLDLLTRKGIFPYEFVDAHEKLELTHLPIKEEFYSRLKGSDVSDDDYAHAERVWLEFGIKTLGEYSDLYLKIDVLLLADVFENFRDNCLHAYGLDPAHYYTTPGLTWDAMLKYTGIELELLTDIDMLLFVERGIRGGVSQCSNRYARANNPYTDDYDSHEDTTYLMYYDVNNLYGWAMMQHLPYGGFEWIENVEKCRWNVPDDSPVGYILEVDLDYPIHLHDAHSDFPLCPEQRKPPGSTQSKLLTTLTSKSRYVIHYRNLKQAIDHGLHIRKIHRILKFDQSPWMKVYIDLNSEMRKRAKNDFEKNLYKLMNNAVFGKTMENVRKRVDVKLLTQWTGRYGVEAMVASPNFHSRSIFTEDLVAVELRKTEVLFNKPIYVGFCVLDISKTCVYNFHYNYMRKQFENQCKLLYTDTDSLIYEIRCPDIYAVMKRDIRYFDTSDYNVANTYGIPLCNKKVVGLMKDECNGRIITEFVGLRSKMYSVRVEGVDAMKKAKGVKATVVRNDIRFDDYVECLAQRVTQHRRQYLFRSRLHRVYTIEQVKLALSPFDDKRCLLSNTTDTLPWGHYRIKETEEDVDDDMQCDDKVE